MLALLLSEFCSSSELIDIPCSSIHFFKGKNGSIQSVASSEFLIHNCHNLNGSRHGDFRKNLQNGHVSSSSSNIFFWFVLAVESSHAHSSMVQLFSAKKRKRIVKFNFTGDLIDDFSNISIPSPFLMIAKRGPACRLNFYRTKATMII